MIEQINNSTETFTYKEVDLVIPANGQVVYQNPYNFIRLLDSNGTNNALKFQFGASSLETFLSVGIGLKFASFLPSVTIRNETNAAVTIRISEIYGAVTDDRLVVSGKVDTSEVAYTTFSQSELTFDANGEAAVDSSAYRHLVIQNASSTNPIYIGASNGFKIDQGGSFEMNYAGQITVYGTTGETIKVGYFA